MRFYFSLTYVESIIIVIIIIFYVRIVSKLCIYNDLLLLLELLCSKSVHTGAMPGFYCEEVTKHVSLVVHLDWSDTACH